MDNYLNIVDQLGNKILPFEDEFEEGHLVIGSCLMKFRFKTDDNFVYNAIINIPVCVISLSSIVKQGIFYYSQFRLPKCFYESKN